MLQYFLKFPNLQLLHLLKKLKTSVVLIAELPSDTEPEIVSRDLHDQT